MSQGSHQIQTQAQQLLQTLSPYQILVVKLLELPTMELEERVRAEILDNPALEEGKEMPEHESTDDFGTDFNEDNTFELYQHTYTVLWVRYTGSFSLNGSTLTGVYSDGEKWNSYTIKYNGETKQIRLTNAEKNEESIYTSTTIPTEIVEDATDAVNVRSVVFEKFL